MQAISVINFKGGVGKTTITANLGVDLARRGYRVMLLDLDPQSSLTFSFYSPDAYQRELRSQGRTIKNWLDGFHNGRPITNLGKFFAHPVKLNQQFESGGFVQIVPSDLELINLELRMFTSGAAPRNHTTELEVLNRRGALRDAIREFPIADYDFVLMDCPPGMSLLTQSAIVASDHLIVPTRPDYLSTVGILSLMKAIDDLQVDYNGQLSKHGLISEREFMQPHMLGIVFTMVAVTAHTRPIGDHQFFIDRVKAEFPRSATTGADATFAAMVRANNRHYGNALPADGFPVMSTWTNNPARDDLQALTDEFLTKFPGLRRAAAA